MELIGMSTKFSEAMYYFNSLINKAKSIESKRLLMRAKYRYIQDY